MTHRGPTAALTELLEQHETLRAIMDHCEALADDVDTGRGSADELVSEVVRLRVAFDLHNRSEERLLRPILAEGDAFGDVRIERMISDHVGEHRVMRDRLVSGPTAELRATIATLRQHLEIEERHFLSSQIVRDDLVIVEGGG